MRISQIGILAAGLFLTSSGIAFTQDNPVPDGAAPSAASEPVSAGSWTLEALQEMALQNNPTMRQATASVDMARGLHRQVGLYPNPQLGYLRNDADISGKSRSAGAFFGQEIVTKGKLKKAQAAEAWEIEQGNWNYEAQTHRVRNDIALRFYEVLAAQQAYQLSGRLENLALRGFQTTEKLFNAKEAPKGDLLQARIQYKSAQLSKKEAQARLTSSWTQLVAITGCSDLQYQPLSGQLAGTVPELDFKSEWDHLRDNSPLIGAAKARAQHFQGTYQLERANATPNFNVQVVAERDQIGKFSTVSTLISMPIPVYNRNQGNISRAAAQTHESAAEVQRTELALKDQLAEAFRRYETAKAQVQELEASILPDAQESLELSIASYKASEVNFLTVLTAQRTYIEASVADLDAWLELRKVTTEIDGMLLTGALNPAEVGTALQNTGGAQRRGVLNQIQESQRSSSLPAALQTSAGR